MRSQRADLDHLQVEADTELKEALKDRPLEAFVVREAGFAKQLVPLVPPLADRSFSDSVPGRILNRQFRPLLLPDCWELQVPFCQQEHMRLEKPEKPELNAQQVERTRSLCSNFVLWPRSGGR